MKRTTISLSDDLARVLEREASRRHLSVSEVTRQALFAYLGLAATQARHIPFAALGDSGHRHTAQDIEHIIAKDWRSAGNR